MTINWDVVIKIAVPIITLLLGKYLDRWLTKRPKLISYLGHASAFSLHSENPSVVHTHAIVVRNAGREPANNVRIGHNVLPEHYQIYPSVPHEVKKEQNGSAELIISKLVPSEQVTISYLYFPPLLWNQINLYTKSDEGFAKILKVIPTPQYPKWLARSLSVLVFIGAVSLIYFLIQLIRWVMV